jgi:penicillin-binding protein 2
LLIAYCAFDRLMAKSLAPTPLGDHREPPTREELHFVSRRLTVLFLAFLAAMLVYLGRTYQLTVVQGPAYRDLSDNNFLLQTPLPAPRGRILDRHGEPLAVNQPIFQMEMSPFRLGREQVAATLERLAALLDQPALAGKVDAIFRHRPRWETVTLASNLPLERVVPVMEQAFDLPGVQVTQDYRRYYPAGETAGLITGHVGGIDAGALDAFQAKGYLPDEKVGRLGTEAVFEDLLHGEHGLEIVTRDAQGRVRARQGEIAARSGRTVVLTIDMGLQRLADKLLEGWRGAVIAMDPRDGAVLAMVAHPGYEPERPAWSGTPDRPRSSFNRAVNGIGFAPGSTFKIVTAAAGLRAGFSPDEKYFCGGSYELSGARQKFLCNVRWGHESQNMYEALQHSCNVFFYRWAQRAGAAAFVDVARQFGIGRPTGFELESANPYDPPGHLATPGFDEIYTGSLLQMGIGQGQLLSVTPLQLTRAYAALCNGGILYQPRLFKEERSLDGKIERSGQKVAQGRLPIDDEQRRAILEGLWRVVNQTGGTAARYGIKPAWRVAGKTGTAQTGRPKSDAWFVCFAPAEAPEILLLVLVEDSGHGGEVCAPLARQLLAYHFGEPEPAIVPPPKEVPPGTISDD